MDKFDEKIIGYVEMVDWVSPEFSARAYSDQPRARRSYSMRPKMSNVGFSRSMVDLLVKIVVITYDFIVPRLDR